MIDVAVIGAGITGTFIARELSRYEIKVMLIEKDNDIANGTTKANSAIIHAGYDALPSTLKAKLNVRGNEMYEEICKELHVPFKRIGSLVVAFNDKEMKVVKELYDRGLKNGVPDMEIIDNKRLMEVEPNLREEAVGALYAKSAGIIGPWEMAIALAENAADNGVEILLNSPVTSIDKRDDNYHITAGDREIEAKVIINCAGLYADDINNMVNQETFEITPNRGEYNLFDKTAGSHVNAVVFGCPSDEGKGVVILPTVHGNLLLGPTSEYVDGKDSTTTTHKGLLYIEKHALSTIKGVNFRKIITSFTGLRAKVKTHDFIIEESKESLGFFNVAGIDSPGLSAAPAIAEYVMELVKNRLGDLKENNSFNPTRRPLIHFADLSDDEKAELIKKDPRYGRVICRCENVTEGEIVDIIKRNAGGTTVDGIKRRARPGSGRCQGGFCGPRVMEIIARELSINITEVLKDGKGSYILTGPTK